MPPNIILQVNMSLTAISPYVFTDETADGRMKMISWLQACRLLATTMACNCGASNMDMIIGAIVQELRMINGPGGAQVVASSIKSIRSGSWFEGT